MKNMFKLYFASMWGCEIFSTPLKLTFSTSKDKCFQREDIVRPRKLETIEVHKTQKLGN